MTVVHRPGEAGRLLLPGRAAGDHVQSVPEEALGGGVLVQASGQVGQGVAEVPVGGGRDVEQQLTRTFGHHRRRAVGHAGQHFDVDRGPFLGRQDQGQSDVEEIVRRHPHGHGGVGRRLEQALEERHIGSVGVGLGAVRRRRPVVEFGVDVLHGQVGPFDQPDPDGGPAGLAASAGPVEESVESGVGVGEVGLQRDPGRQRGELLVVEGPDEGLHGEIEIAVLLHVQIDELGRRRGRRPAVEMAQGPGDPLHRSLEVDQRQPGGHRRHLDRDAVHVRTAQQGLHRRRASLRLLPPEDGLAQEVHVGSPALTAQAGQPTTERSRFGRIDERSRLVAQAGGHQAHHRSRGPTSGPGGQAQQGPVDRGDPLQGGVGDGGQLAGRRAAVGGPQDPVGQGEDEAGPRSAGQQTPQPELAPLLPAQVPARAATNSSAARATDRSMISSSDAGVMSRVTSARAGRWASMSVPSGSWVRPATAGPAAG